MKFKHKVHKDYTKIHKLQFLERIFTKHKQAKEFFSSLSHINQKEYLTFIESAKRADTKQRRLESVLEKLMAGKKTPQEK